MAPKMLTTRSNDLSCRPARPIAFLETDVAQALLLGAALAGGDQVAGDVDAQHIGAEPGRGHCRRAVATAEVEDLESLPDADRTDERFAAFPHGRGNAREVAF